MIAAVILLVTVLVPGRPPEVSAYPMPSVEACGKAAARIEDHDTGRVTTCLVMSAAGRDA